MSYTKNSWKLFHEMFKEGDDIIVINDYDYMYWGKLKICEDKDYGFYLIRLDGHRTLFEWEDIRFMANDGFPVEKLKGADGSASIEKIDTTNTQKLIRGGLKLHELPLKERAEYGTSSMFGDPFLIENCKSTLFNSGNTSYQHYLADVEECLVLESKDGAKAQLYDLSTIYHYERAS